MAKPQDFESVMILGAGAFGLLHLLALKAAGVRTVAVAGRREARLKMAGELGADLVIDVEKEEPGRAIAKLNGGHGPDLVIECTGQVAGWEDSVRWARRGGRVMFFGGCAAGTSLALDTRRMHYDNLTLLAPFHFTPRDVRQSFELLEERRLGAARVINARRGLSEIREVFSQLERGTILKCAIVP